MLTTKRLSAIVGALAVVLSLSAARPATGQISEQVSLFFNIERAASTAVSGFSPAQIRQAYGFDQIANQGKGQVIAIVDSFDHPNIEQDLAVFNGMFGLPECTTANGCFKKVYASGTNPGTNALWAFEIALDVEWAHAIAPQAKIVLVEAMSDQLGDLIAAVDIAVGPTVKATVVSMSWGLPEGNLSPARELELDGHFVGLNRTFFASAGDSGHGTMYPAASPYAMGVGGTSLILDDSGNYQSEKAWSGSGGGLSLYEPEPVYQLTYPIPNDPQGLRGTPDVAYVADPKTGLAMYDSVPFIGSAGWFEVGGTSVGSPQWAGLVAIANSMRAAKKKPPLTGSQGVLYTAAKEADGNYHDIVKGHDGGCGKPCKAAPDYDYVTGLGTPQANQLIPDLRDLP